MRSQKLSCLTLCTALTSVIGFPALADDTEIFFGSSNITTGTPNIMLVLDTSGSMAGNIQSTTSYDPAATYSGNCSGVYFRRSSNSTLPQCSSGGGISNERKHDNVDNNGGLRGRIALSDFYCSPATGSGGAFETAGYYQDAGIRWITKSSGSNKYSWNPNLNPDSGTSARGIIACEQHNYGTQYPRYGSQSSDSNKWTNALNSSYWKSTNARTQYIFYSANYLNWHYNHRVTSTQTRLQIVQSAAKNLVDSVSSVNIGLMRYDAAGNGGMVLEPVQNIDTGRTAIKNRIDGMKSGGNTPLSETLSEAHRYFTGGSVQYGNNSYICKVNDNGTCDSSDRESFKSVASSRVGNDINSNQYQTPMEYSCQKNYIVYLTDGEPNNDTDANSYINSLSTSDVTCSSSNGACLKTLTSYMYDNDLSTSLPDKQNITTYFIGFGDDVASGDPFDYLDDAAKAGGGSAYSATDFDSLTSKLNEILQYIKDDSATFTSPSVAVNAFNKTQILEDLYISVFQPSSNTHWAGNLKKYKLRDSQIVGQNASVIGSAVDTDTGFFKNTARSYWSAGVDGSNTASGGAANLIPAPASRKVYTYVGASNPSVGSFPNLASSVNYSVEDGNSLITTTVLGVADSATRTTLLNWARGQDVDDEDGDGSTTDARNMMGDPIHSQPAVVIYGNDDSSDLAQLNDAVVYVATNDGYLHAIDVVSGVELWSFIPQELLGNLVTLRNDPPRTTKLYSLDGNIRVLKYDVDGDGVVEPADNDRVFLYFSQGRGGDRYYAMDVTNKSQPKFMWSLGASDLGGVVSQSWSTPTLGRVRVDGATQNPQRLVLIFAGGYDVDNENAIHNASNTNGRGIFMVDAVRGTVLWSQTQTNDGSAFDKMTHAIPSNVTVLDTNADGWSDRMYVGDMAGQLWRFDIHNGNSASSTTDPLVTGGVIASLGHQSGDTGIATDRKFFNAPDVAKMVVQGGANYYNIAIGSGDRGRPKSNTTTQDRFYSIRDYRLGAMTQAQYNNSLTPILDSDLTNTNGSDAISLPSDSKGWKLLLNDPNWEGEKVLADSITVDGKVLFTTYVPNGGTVSTACKPSSGAARAYTLHISSGLQVFDDLYEEFSTTGLPSQVTIINEGSVIRTDDDNSSSSSSSSSSGTPSNTGTCLSGVAILGSCVDFGSRVKTFWQEAGAN